MYVRHRLIDWLDACALRVRRVNISALPYFTVFTVNIFFLSSLAVQTLFGMCCGCGDETFVPICIAVCRRLHFD